MRGLRWLILAALALLLLFQTPRLLRILRGEDSSARARSVYFEAGREGFLARPLLGQGPGAVAWTASLFLDPAPGVNPWGEAVGDLHSLPVQVAYELGAPGLLLVLGLIGMFGVRRLREMGSAADPGAVRASLAGLAGGAVALLGTAALVVTALPLSLAVAAGAGLSGRGREGQGPVRVYAALAVLALAPLLVAQALYDAALSAEQAGRREVARARLARAIRLDPAFPLYRMRLALLQESGERSAAAEMARRAAQDGQGVQTLWTVAGILGQAAERPWAPAALQTACSLDPLSPLPPWFGMLADPSGQGASRRGAHALLAEPRLAAGVFWADHPALFGSALAEIRSWPGIDPSWKQSLLEAVPSSGAGTGEREWLALTLDVDPQESVSLFTFRRRPWPAEWPVVPLSRGPLERLRLAPAASLPGVPRAAFDPAVCAGGFPL